MKIVIQNHAERPDPRVVADFDALQRRQCRTVGQHDPITDRDMRTRHYDEMRLNRLRADEAVPANGDLAIVRHKRLAAQRRACADDVDRSKAESCFDPGHGAAPDTRRGRSTHSEDP